MESPSIPASAAMISAMSAWLLVPRIHESVRAACPWHAAERATRSGVRASFRERIGASASSVRCASSRIFTRPKNPAPPTECTAWET